MDQQGQQDQTTCVENEQHGRHCNCPEKCKSKLFKLTAELACAKHEISFLESLLSNPAAAENDETQVIVGSCTSHNCEIG